MNRPHTAPLVVARDLDVVIGDRPIVSGVSFTIPRGGSLALVGESGSGKTVTSRVFTGLLRRIGGRVTSGEATIDGIDVASLSDEQWRPLRGRRVALVPQASLSGLDPVLRIGNQLTETIRTLDPEHPSPRDRALELLGQVRLPHPEALLRRYPHELSGGMRQRVMIALALVGRPELMVADEPTTALDVTVQRDILQLLNDLRAESGMALLLIAHDLAAVQEVCDDVAVMNRGSLVEQGPTGTVLHTPAEPYTRALLAARPENARPGQALAVLDAESGELVHPAIPDAPVAARGIPETLVSMVDVMKHYRGAPAPALQPVSVDITEGEALGVVGESGSGKSTFGKILVGALAPTSGAITVAGQEWVGLNRRSPLRRQVQMVFQDPYGSLTPWRTPRQIVADVLQRWEGLSRTDGAERAGQLLTEVGLPATAMDRRTSNLSGGQCQRTGIARALACEPRLLVADEPTSSLDVSIQAQILNLLLELRRNRGLTLVLISHDLGVVRHMTDRALVLTDGQVVESGQTSDVLENPQDDYTRRLVASTPTLRRSAS